MASMKHYKHRCYACGLVRFEFPVGGNKRYICRECYLNKVPKWSFLGVDELYCPKCDAILHVSAFNKRKAGFKERQNACRMCHNAVCKRNQRRFQLERPKEYWSYYTHYRILKRLKDTGRECSDEMVADFFILLSAVFDRCGYCAKELSYIRKPRFHGNNRWTTFPESPTIDRIDNSRGYTANNIMVVCHECNTSKHEKDIHTYLTDRCLPDVIFESAILARDSVIEQYRKQREKRNETEYRG